MGEPNFERQYNDPEHIDGAQTEITPLVSEKREIISLDNFNITLDKKTEHILGKENIAQSFEQIKEQVDLVLGQEWDLGGAKIDISLFSNRGEYEDFLIKNFPNKSDIYIKDNAIFDQDPKTFKKTIVNYTPIKELSEQDRQRVQEYGMSIEEADKIIAQVARANALSSVAHEMTHLHPFFGGVGNIASPTKWEQEMVCVFVGEKVRTEAGNENHRQTTFKQAQDELRQQETLNLEDNGKDWEAIKKYEGFFYPYLEKQYGLEKLQTLWQGLFREPKQSLSEALEKTYQKSMGDIEKDFRSTILSSDRYEEVELSD